MNDVRDRDWYWEGRVVDALEKYLMDYGWTVIEKADTETRARGVDLVATKGKKMLLVEAKGYPSKVYARGEKKGTPKPTNPRNQAPKVVRSGSAVCYPIAS